jgi:DNA-binding LytR/AlgR family response regulator
MNKINCLIADDEPIAREIIQTYCKYIPILNVVASCGNSFEAKAALQKQKIDIVFLDINMPVLDGIAFLKTIKNPPAIIFTTAYKEFAVEAFDLSACDYLVKPFSLERFIVAVDKGIEKLKITSPQLTTKNEVANEDFIFIKALGKIYKLGYDEIQFAEAKGNFVKIVTANNNIMPSITFSNFEKMLPKEIFIRVHRSFIINKSKINRIEGNRVFINKNEVPIGSNYKVEFLKALGL